MVLLANSIPPWPVYVDDDGTGQTGTPLDSSFFDNIQASLNYLLHSNTNPGIPPSQITDEVVTARGTQANLNARLSVGMNPDGSLIIPSSVAFTAPQAAQALGWGNLLANEDFIIWSGGDNSTIGPTGIPDHWYWSSTGAFATHAFQRVVGAAGLANLFQFSVKSAPDGVSILNQRVFESVPALVRGMTFTCGVIVTCDANTAAVTLTVFDGITTQVVASANIAIPGTPQGIAGSVTISPGASQLVFSIKVQSNSGTTTLVNIDRPYMIPAYATVIPAGSTTLPYFYIPSPREYVELFIDLPGNLVVSANSGRRLFVRPFKVTDVVIVIGTAPTGSTAIFDFFNGVGGNSMYQAGSRPTIAIGAKSSTYAPTDNIINSNAAGGYMNSCFWQNIGAELTPNNNYGLVASVVQKGSTVAGADATIAIRGIRYTRPQIEGIAPLLIGNQGA